MIHKVGLIFKKLMSESSSEEIVYPKGYKGERKNEAKKSFSYGEEEEEEEASVNEGFSYGDEEAGDAELAETLASSELWKTRNEEIAAYASLTAPAGEELSVKDQPLNTLWSPYAHRFVSDFTKTYPIPQLADWNAAFGWATSLSADSQFEREQRTLILELLFDLFTETGKAFAFKLIDESLLPEAEQTIKPSTRFGGVAGGKKYAQTAHSTQIFKFAEDVELPNGRFLYGGKVRNDRLAQKAAGHELKSTQALVDAAVPELFFPMMSIFTYKNKRVTCASIVPLKELLQGQASVKEGLKTVPENSNVDQVMKALGGALNLTNQPLGIVGPFDLEVHQGTDGKIYIIDTARLFPPESGRNSMFYLLRPELVKRSEAALASDAYFGSITRIRNCSKLQQDIANAVKLMQNEMKNLGEQIRAGRVAFGTREERKKEMHARGINMRHLSKVLEHAGQGGKKLEPFVRPLVKSLRPPAEMTREQLQKTIVQQAHMLKDEGSKSRMKLVPTLLRWGVLLGNEVPFQLCSLFHYQNVFSVGGDHPFCQAFQVCLKEQELVIDVKTAGIVKSSALCQIVIFYMLRHMAQYPIAGITEAQRMAIRAPNRDWLQNTPKYFPEDSPIKTQIMRFYNGFQADPIWDCLKDAALNGDKAFVLEMARKHQSPDAACAAFALAGDAETLQQCAKEADSGKGKNLGLLVHQMRNMLQWACEGTGKTDVVELYLNKGMPPDIYCTLAAAIAGNIATMELLLKKGVNLNEHQERNGKQRNR
jgi:hypothetical protein